MTANHRTELAKYWRNIDNETNTSLQQIKTDAAEALLDGMFKKEFLRKTMARITGAYERVVDDILLGESSGFENATVNPMVIVLRTPMHAIGPNIVTSTGPPVEQPPNHMETQTVIQPMYSEANNSLIIHKSLPSSGQNISRLGGVTSIVELQPEMDSFLNNRSDADRRHPPNDVKNGEDAFVNQDIEFDSNEVLGGSNRHGNSDTFIASNEVLENGTSNQISGVAVAADEHRQPNEGLGNVDEKAINLSPLDGGIIDLTAECEASNTPDDSLNRRANAPKPVDRPKRKHAFESDSGQSSKKRKIDADWTPVRDKKDGKYHCGTCAYATSHSTNSKRHYRIHSGEKPYKCKICTKVFARKHYLNSHARIHEKHFEFQCASCLRRFKSQDSKELHQKSCKKRSYECYLCQYITPYKHLIVSHFRNHTGEKPFQCSHCPERFIWRSLLTRHIERHHK